MVSKEDHRKREKATPSPHLTDETAYPRHADNSTAVTGILDERIQNLREAIEEIDEALAGRKTLNHRFLEQIDREAKEVLRHLKMLQEPWAMGFHTEVEFLRLSFHKSLTSRAKERRSEELKYWENSVNLAKERRKFLDEYKALIATKRRLQMT